MELYREDRVVVTNRAVSLNGRTGTVKEDFRPLKHTVVVVQLDGQKRRTRFFRDELAPIYTPSKVRGKG